MVVRFGDFEFSRPALRLSRGGIPIRLTGQPLQLLMVLLEEPGRLVTRDEIRARLWPDTTVEFDHGLDVALNRLRAALGETARAPRYIETVPRLGYRFIARVCADTERPRRQLSSAARRVAMYALTALVGALLALGVVHQHYDKIVSRGRQTSR